MKNRILLTTTDSITDTVTERYIGLVTSNVVVGTNFFSDFKASFTDVFGGFSNTYQKRL